jgi:hypothetical protein
MMIWIAMSSDTDFSGIDNTSIFGAYKTEKDALDAVVEVIMDNFRSYVEDGCMEDILNETRFSALNETSPFIDFEKIFVNELSESNKCVFYLMEYSVGSCILN